MLWLHPTHWGLNVIMILDLQMRKLRLRAVGEFACPRQAAHGWKNFLGFEPKTGPKKGPGKTSVLLDSFTSRDSLAVWSRQNNGPQRCSCHNHPNL